MNDKTIWKAGEDEAIKFLMDLGHTILERNWRAGHLEIDIISYDSSGIHFVEVKSRKSPIGYSPEECVNKQKQRNITSAAKKYIRTNKNKITDVEYHFDIIAIIFSTTGSKIRYFEDAWLPIYT